MRLQMRFFGLVSALALMFLAAAPAWAQADYPTRAVNVVVPFPPGGAADLHARALGAALEPMFKKPLMVINKQGAGGAVGLQYASIQKPDGYTIVVALSSLPFLYEVDKLFDRKPAYQEEDFIPIALLSADPVVITVHKDSPWKTIDEFVADAKKRPDQINLGSAGKYSTMHVGAELFTMAANIKLNHIPYTGGGPSLKALLGRHIDTAAFSPSVVMAQMQAGTVRPLLVIGNKRLASMPDVPTTLEKGWDAEFYIWAGVFALKGTPDPIVQKLRDSVRKAVESPEFIKAMKQMKTPIHYLDQPDFIKFIQKDGSRTRKAVRDIGKI
ncbi:MAG: tripartite tricarboxylate transporter substrate binding protein [Deltaproteobacteria bacterium]|nr:tripartite tricarboxylate transporter substrate binding protein [Deltaproteobacteria bacterium]